MHDFHGLGFFVCRAYHGTVLHLHTTRQPDSRLHSNSFFDARRDGPADAITSRFLRDNARFRVSPRALSSQGSAAEARPARGVSERVGE